MFNNEGRKLERLNQIVNIGEEVSESKYNLYLGACVCYGFLMNAISIALWEDFFLSMNPIVFLVGYFISCIVGTIIAVGSSSPLISFLGYNLIVLPIGGLLTISLGAYTGADILLAMSLTGVVTLIMTLLSIAKPNFFRGLGKTLFLSLILGIIVEVIAMILGFSTTIFDFFFVVIFALYIGYDYVKAQDYPKTIDNAIDSAIDIYLDIINLFLRILSIIAKSDD